MDMPVENWARLASGGGLGVPDYPIRNWTTIDTSRRLGVAFANDRRSCDPRMRTGR